VDPRIIALVAISAVLHVAWNVRLKTAGEPLRAATVISRITLVQEEARLASVIAFLRLICFHLLWPAMAELLGDHQVWMTADSSVRHPET